MTEREGCEWDDYSVTPKTLETKIANNLTNSELLSWQKANKPKKRTNKKIKEPSPDLATTQINILFLEALDFDE